MGWEKYLTVDWGTTNRRAYLVDGSGTLLESFEDDIGVLAVPGGEFEAALAEIYARLGHWPMLLAGMIGSSRGWVEAPYVAAPARLGDLAAAIHWVHPDRIGIVPGVSLSIASRADVMRGEEVQVFGAISAGLVPRDCRICLPGTHAKWIVVQDGTITDFRTMMTGEIFALLKAHSILADQLQQPVTDDARFRDGVRQAWAGEDLLSGLFSVRARALLGGNADGAAWASGLLIGSDVRAALVEAGQGPIALVGRPDLCALYAAALSEGGRSSERIDGNAAFLAGVHALVEMM